MLLSMTTAAAIPAAAEENTAAADYGLAERSADGVILHCFDWSFSTIKQNLPQIAAAGYTTVQTSPVQQPKDYGPWFNGEGQWWKLYQPLSFSIAVDGSWLGTKDELTDLCQEADKYGIKIICDIVSNHMANQSANSYLSYGHDIKKYEPEIYKGSSQYFHQLKKGVNDSNLEWLVQGALDYLPDLNTGDEFVQSRVISLLKECIDCGVDGFRFDAAKHIETPADGDFASDFWPNITSAANEYAAEKGQELFMYGEVLNSPGKGRSTLDYTKYINLTDNKAGDITLYNVAKKNPEKVLLGQNYTYTDDDPSHFVLWAESHDTYMGKSGAGGFNNTKGVSNEDIAKTWAIVAARAKSHSLYFARPNELMGMAGDTAWKSTVVTEINRFHNKFIGTDDEIYADGSIIAVQRGDNGIVLVDLGEDPNVSVNSSDMKDGEYVDAITGNTFTVADGKISGTIGASGVAVIYKDAATSPKIFFSEEEETFRRDTYPITLTYENADYATFSINGAEPVRFDGIGSIVIGEGIEPGNTITVTAAAYKGDQKYEETHTYFKQPYDKSGVYVYYDNSETNFKNVYAYGFYEYIDDSGRKVPVSQDGQWPGTKMEFDAEKNMYVYEVPSDIPLGKGSVIINNGVDWETPGMTVEVNESVYNAAQKKLISLNGIPGMYGDLTDDSDLTSEDALAILRCSLDSSNFTPFQIAAADVDKDGDVTSADALAVLRYSAELPNAEGCVAGESFVFGGTSDSSDPKPSDNSNIKPSGNIFYAVNSAGWVFVDGCKLWLYNRDTKEAVEMTKQDEQNDSSKYAYVDLPQGWVNLNIYRTTYDVDYTAIDNENYRAASNFDPDSAYNHWELSEIPEGKNSYYMTGDGTGKFKSYDPNK